MQSLKLSNEALLKTYILDFMIKNSTYVYEFLKTTFFGVPTYIRGY